MRRILMMLLLLFLFLLRPAMICAQVIGQGEPNADASAWPIKVVVGGTAVDPRLVTAAQGAAAATSDANAWPIKIVFGGTHIDPRLVTVQNQSANSTAVAVRCVNAAGSAFVECGIGGAGSTDVDDGSIAGGQTVGLGAALANVWSGAAWVRLTQGQATMAASVPVAIASNQTAIPINANDGAGNALASATGAPGVADRGLVTRLMWNQRLGTAVTFNDGADTAEVALEGSTGASFRVEAGTLNTTLLADYTLDGTEWTTTTFNYQSTSVGEGVIVTGVVVNNNVVQTIITPLIPPGTLRVRLSQTGFVGGSAQVRGYAGNVDWSQLSARMLLAFDAGCVSSTLTCIRTVATDPTSGGTAGVSTGGGLKVTLNDNNSSNQNEILTAAPSGPSEEGLVVRPYMPTDGTNSVTLTGTSMNVNCTGGCGGAPTFTDGGAGFTQESSAVNAPAGFIVDDTIGTALSENDIAAARITPARAQVMRLEGATRGTYASLTGTSVDVNCTGGCGSPPTSTPITIGFNESVAAGFAGVWETRRDWTPPAGTVFTATRAASMVTTAGSRSMAAVGNSLGMWNENTNVFTDGASVAAPHHYARLFALVFTNRSATANTITVTYVNDFGSGGNTATCAMPATALTQTRWVECTFNPLVGNQRSAGIRDITAVSDSAAPATGVVSFFGLNPILDTLGIANDLQTTTYDTGVQPTTDTLFLMIMQASTTAQQRGIYVTGSIR
jgi:hypothetical protein